MNSFIYLDDVLSSGEPVYVRNISSEEDRGMIALVFNDNGSTQRELIPNTYYPICLSNKATPDMIKQSSSLRRAIDAGVLELVPQDKAEMELSREGARAALEAAVLKTGYKNPDIARMRGVSDKGSDIPQIAALPNSAPDAFAEINNDPIQMEVATTEPAPRVQHIIEARARNDMKVGAAKNDLMNMKLTQTDLQYIIGASTGTIQKYAKEEMSRLSSDDSFIEEV